MIVNKITTNNIFIKSPQKQVSSNSNIEASKTSTIQNRDICFKGMPSVSNIIINYKNDVPSFIYPIDIARKILGRNNVFDMAIGNPDLRAPETALKRLITSSQDGRSHRYCMTIGEQRFRTTIADWYKKRFNCDINPNKNVIVTNGGANGIDTLLMSYCNPGDNVLIPNIGYPVYRDLLIKNNLNAQDLKLNPKNNYQIDFSELEKMDLSKTKAMIINYPHNPTGVFASDETLQKALSFCKKHNILLIHDFDSSEITQNGILPKSILEFDKTGENSAVVHTMSKSHNLPGMRVGFIVSNPETIQHALAIKNASEMNTYVAIQEAATEALTDYSYIDNVNSVYRKRKSYICDKLKELNVNISPSAGTYYMWLQIPKGFSDVEFAKYLLYKTGLAVTPGSVFQPNNKSFVRLVMSQSIENMEQIFKNIKKQNIRFDISKDKLSQDLIQDIESYSHPIYSTNPLLITDYKVDLLRKIEQLKFNYQGKPDKYQRLIPSLDYILNTTKSQKPRYFSFNVKSGKKEELFTDEILPFSSPEVYDKLRETLRNQWINYKKEHPEAKLLDAWANLELYPDLTYITIKDLNGKIQSLVGFKKLENGTMRSRMLNTAPWNQTKDVEFKHAGKIAIAAECNYALECGIDKISYEVAPHHVKFYKKFGAIDDGIVTFNNKDYKKLIINLKNPLIQKYIDLINTP